MESEILKFICANQGAVNTDDLLFNLDSPNVSEIISNRDTFVSCCPNGQPKVVARTRLRLCRAKDCPGQCRGLHLCKNFLFNGHCHYTQLRRGCSFSHELNSEHNQRILREHGLESLSRAELCTLLLQSDDGLLPAICFDYNNGLGEFGRCNEGNGCKRMHICEIFLKQECMCFRAHSFFDPQPLKSLKDKGVPDDLFRFLKAVYANKEALRNFNKSNRGNGQRSSTTENDATSHRGRGRGRRGHRGNRGNRGNGGNQSKLQPAQRAHSIGDINDDISGFNLYTIDGLDISAAASDNDASSEDGWSVEPMEWATAPPHNSAAVGGRHGSWSNRGNHQPLQKTRSTHALTSAVGNKDADSSSDQKKWQRPVKDKTEICMYFIKGHCRHEEKCFKAHDKMPYRWQVKEGDEWKAMPNNETIEKDYCDPQNTSSSSSSPPVHFDTMTCGPKSVRRLSTVNSLREPTFIHTTEWAWYWEDELGKWNLFASGTGGPKRTVADIDSAKLEQAFLDNDKDVVEFSAGSQSYTLSFQDMIQTNKHYGTKRLVKRRPIFVSAEDVKEKRVRRPLGQMSLAAIPNHWDKTQVPSKGYKSVSLLRTSEEFKEVEALFCKTMRGYNIVKIERVQNKNLWEVFQWQKNQMKDNRRDVLEKKLFHGTDSKYVDAICKANFDWRICGTHGTAFGKGSYFARDAKYSHNYTDSNSDVKSMFVSRVLVGDFTRGSSDYRRPPSKDGGDVNFFDSCVDDVIDPSIFVVFEKHQIYPEYLLQYKTMHPLVSLYSGAPAAAPAPTPRPTPRPAPQPNLPVYQPNTISHPPNLSVYQSGIPSSRPSTSVPQRSSFSSQPTVSSYQSATFQYQPRQSPPPPISKTKKPDSCVIA